MSPRQIELEEFLPLVGQVFDLHCDPDNVPITLIAAERTRQHAIDARQPFTLIFHSSPDILLVDGTYVMTCGAFGPEAIDISPIMSPSGSAPGYHYQAVFN